MSRTALNSPSYYYGVGRGFQPILAEIGLGNSDAVFDHAQIQVWRRLADRENAVLDATLSDGRTIRLHVKRYAPKRRRGGLTAGEAEAEGVFLLERAGIPTLELAAWGCLPDRRSFVITPDLTGCEAADKLIERGEVSFDTLRDATADLAARLHSAGLHHRDLYLCHFFVRMQQDGAPADVRLIDAARVKMLPRWLFRQRWIIKDLAQFWHSAAVLGVDESARAAWLACYASQRRIEDVSSLRRAVEQKANWIARHDQRLRQRQPHRNVSIPR